MHHGNVILYLDVTFHSSELCEALGLPWGFAYLSDAWGVGQHLEHRSSGLSESDVLFLWLLCAGGKCFDHLQAHQTTRSTRIC